MNILALTPAVRDALHSLEETIIDYQLEQQGYTSSLVRLCAAETLVNLTERQKIAFRNNKAFFSPKVDTTKECISILSAVSKTERQPSDAAKSLAQAYNQLEKAEKIAARSANTVNPLELDIARRSEENTSELHSLMRITYAVFCFKKTTIRPTQSSIL